MEMRLRTDSAGRIRFSDDMVGFHVVGDGEEIGTIDRASYDGNWATVSVGRFRKSRHALPSWAIADVEPDKEAVVIPFTKDDVLDSPEYESGVGFAEEYEKTVDAHYRDLGGDEQVRRTA